MVVKAVGQLRRLVNCTRGHMAMMTGILAPMLIGIAGGDLAPLN